MLGVFGVLLFGKSSLGIRPFFCAIEAWWRSSRCLDTCRQAWGHYVLFKLPKYRTNSERMLFAATLVTVLGFICAVVLLLKSRVRVWRSS